MEQSLLVDLVGLAIKGNQEAMNDLCHLKWQSIVYFCTKILGREEDGEDAAQEVFIKMQKGLPKLKNEKSFNAWLYKLARNECINAIKKEKNRKISIVEHEAIIDTVPEFKLTFLPQEHLEKREQRKKLLGIIEELPTGMRTNVYLYYYEGMKPAEIATVLDTTAHAVSSSLHSARMRIKSAMEKSDPEIYRNRSFSFLFLQEIFSTEVTKIPSMPVNMLQRSSFKKGPTNNSAKIGNKNTQNLRILQVIPSSTIKVFSAVVFTIFAISFITVANDDIREFQQKDVIIEYAEENPEYFLPTFHPGINNGTNSVYNETEPSSAMENYLPDYFTKEEPNTMLESPCTSISQDKGIFENVINPIPKMSLQGDVRLLSLSGNTITESLLDTFVLVCINSDGALIAQTTTNTDGSFQFPILKNVFPGEYAVVLKLPNESIFFHSGATPEGYIMVLASEKDWKQTLTFDLVKNVAPSGSLHLVNADCECGHVNPESIELKIEDSYSVDTRWEIVSASDGQILHSGISSSLQLSIATDILPKGLYTLSIYLQDAWQNSAEYKQMILIENGAIDKNQYA